MDSFAGRATRVNYVATTALAWAIFIPVVLFWRWVLNGDFAAPVEMIGAVVLALAAFWISIAVSVRRLHDIGWSGWWWLISFAPLVGTFFGLVLVLWPGQKNANRFGANPRLD